MRSSGRFSRIVIVAAATAVMGVLGTASALALWQSTGTATTSTSARSVPAPAQPPGVTVSGGQVTVTFPARPSDPALTVRGFKVVRYGKKEKREDAGAGCAGVVGASSCVEQSVEAGEWEYAVRYVVGDWTGPESPRSRAVVKKAAESVVQKTLTGQPATDGVTTGQPSTESTSAVEPARPTASATTAPAPAGPTTPATTAPGTQSPPTTRPDPTTEPVQPADPTTEPAATGPPATGSP